ncbi:MAG: hypothetical protein LBU73_04680 [Helicobacteraceae bacterium]|nr:hypothetical protein [Helicobacteraceae bacterium]
MFFAIFSSLLIAEEYFIVSYRQFSRDHTIVSEKFDVARAMQEFSELKIKAEFDVFTEDSDGISTEKLLKIHQDEIVRHLIYHGAIVSDNAHSRRKNTSSKSRLVIPAAKIAAKVKGDLVKITLFE